MARIARLATCVLTVSLSACGIFSDASITKMVPGGNVGTGELECWLTLEFESLPDGGDPRNVEVVFESVALDAPARFGWDFISSHDVIANGGAFGSGYRANDETSADEAPPIGQPIRVKFPLVGRMKIENAPETVWLDARLDWNGKKQDSMKRSLEHVYREEGAAF